VLNELKETSLRAILTNRIHILLLLGAINCFGVEVYVENTRISLPQPPGFVSLEGVSSETYGMMQDLTPETNRLLAGFITKKDAKSLLQGGEAELKEYFLVQTFQKLEEKTFTLSEFGQFRKTIRKDQESAVMLNQEKIDALTKYGSEKLSNRFDADISFGISGVIPLGVSSETAHSIAVSSLSKYEESINGEKSERLIAGTTVFQLVKGKLLYLYIYRDYNKDVDIDWTKDIAVTWGSLIIEANGQTTKNPHSTITTSDAPIPSTVQALIKEQTAEYSTRGHDKSLGIDLSLSYPSSWDAKEGIRPHIVQKFTGKGDGSAAPGCMIIIQDVSTWETAFLESEDWEEILYDATEEMVPPEATIIGRGKTNIDAEPAVWIKFYNQQERAGLKLGMFFLQYVTVYQGKMVMIQCSVAGRTGDRILLEDSFSSYLPLFQGIGNSIVINNKWDSDGVNNTIDDYWLFTLALSLLITWGFGLIPPLIARFVVLRRCFSKPAAIIFSVTFLGVDIVVFTILGNSTSENISLFLVAFASFAILRIGSESDDRERERVHAEKEKLQWEEQANKARADAKRADEEQQFRQNHERERAKAEFERKQWEEQAKKAREDAAKAEEEARKQKQETQDKDDMGHRPRDVQYHANLLGLKGSVTKDQIRKRYRDLASKYHPDRVANLGDKLKQVAELEMKAINESYDYLKKKYKL
jgi:hypothetical protein